MSTAPSLCSVYFHTSKAHPCLYQPTQHNIPQHFPSSVCKFTKDAHKIDSIIHTFQTSPNVTVQRQDYFDNIHTIVLRCVIPVVLSQILQCIICMYLHIYSVRNTIINRLYHYVIYFTVQYTTTCFGLINGPSSDCW